MAIKEVLALTEEFSALVEESSFMVEESSVFTEESAFEGGTINFAPQLAQNKVPSAANFPHRIQYITNTSAYRIKHKTTIIINYF